jgi:hypothetical protein
MAASAALASIEFSESRRYSGDMRSLTGLSMVLVACTPAVIKHDSDEVARFVHQLAPCKGPIAAVALDELPQPVPRIQVRPVLRWEGLPPWTLAYCPQRRCCNAAGVAAALARSATASEAIALLDANGHPLSWTVEDCSVPVIIRDLSAVPVVVTGAPRRYERERPLGNHLAIAVSDICVDTQRR